MRQIADLLSLLQDLQQNTTSFTHVEVAQDDVYNVQVSAIFLIVYK